MEKTYKNGQDSVTISYTEGGITKTVKQNIIVTPNNIVVKEKPNKTTYIKGEELDLTGGKITAIYQSGETEEILMTSEKVSVTGYDKNAVGEQTLTVKYKEKTTTLKVNVINNITEIVINTNPSKTTYIREEELNLAEGKITVVYQNGETEDILMTSEDVSVTGYDKNTIGEQILTVTYKERTTTFKVEVIDTSCSVRYKTHIQDIGWQGWKTNGQKSGTSGQSKRLEGIEIELYNLKGITGGIKYKTHVQNIGWQNYVENGEMSGTSGRSLRLEAIQIQLTGEIAQYYDIYYRVHTQDIGWMGWAKNGELSGTAGYSYRLEAIEIKILKKEEPAPSNIGAATTESFKSSKLRYTTHIQDIGWQEYVKDGDMAGTSGQSKRLEGIKINLDNQTISGNIEYRTHIQDIGWQGWKKNGQMSGTSGQSLRLEAIQIKLTGEIAKEYDVYYRVHAQNFGWLGWTKNGEKSGTAGYSYRLEAIEIKIVKKGDVTPKEGIAFYQR